MGQNVDIQNLKEKMAYLTSVTEVSISGLLTHGQENHERKG